MRTRLFAVLVFAAVLSCAGIALATGETWADPQGEFSDSEMQAAQMVIAVPLMLLLPVGAIVALASYKAGRRR